MTGDAADVPERDTVGSDTQDVTLHITVSHAAALSALVRSSGARDPGLDGFLDELQRAWPASGPQTPSPVDAVLAEAAAVIAGASDEIAAEREARAVATTAAAIDRSVRMAAATTAEAEMGAREKKADATAGAASELAVTAAKTAVGVRVRADALAVEVARAASIAAEAVSTSVRSGHEAEAALTARRLSALVEPAQPRQPRTQPWPHHTSPRL